MYTGTLRLLAKPHLLSRPLAVSRWHQSFKASRQALPEYPRKLESPKSVPEDMAGMKIEARDVTPVLDKQQFDREYTVTALKLPKQHCNKYMKLLRGLVLAKPKVKAVVTDGDVEKRIILLDEGVQGLSESQLTLAFSCTSTSNMFCVGDEKVSKDVRSALQADGSEEITFTMKEDYSLLSTEAVLKRLLPEGCEVPGSFETVGHIAHLNLKEELLPYKHIIGQVIMDKNSIIKTVINKVGILENEYRVLPLEVIAGLPKLEAVVQQHKARFKLNIAEVYWNSRLEEEHTRLVQTFKPGEVVADIMAGVGPFAIPAAQRGCQVFANDLNPWSFHYLKENIKLNKVSDKVQAFELDGRKFIRLLGGAEAEADDQGTSRSEGVESTCSASRHQNGAATPEPDSQAKLIVYDHAIMNLPASAVEFLDAFKGSFSRHRWKGRNLPLVHVYTFARTAETDAEIQKRVEHCLGGSLSDDEVKIRLVRDVAPNKRMMRVDFRVPEHVAFSQNPTPELRGEGVTEGAPSSKKLKLTNS